MLTVSKAKASLTSLIRSPIVNIIYRGSQPAAALVPYEEYLRMAAIVRQHQEEEILKIANLYRDGNTDDFEEIDLDKI